MLDLVAIERVTATRGHAQAVRRRSVLLRKTARRSRLQAICIRNDARCARRFSHGPVFALDDPADLEAETRIKRVLIVDDNPGVRESMAEILRLASYDVREADGTESALSVLLEEELDLVLLDLGLDLKGFELLDRAERLPPVILMSGSGEDSISDARISLFLKKPIFPARLIEEVALHSSRKSEG